MEDVVGNKVLTESMPTLSQSTCSGKIEIKIFETWHLVSF